VTKGAGLWGLFVVVDFNVAARDSRTYPEYEHKLANGQVSCLSIVVHGAARAVTSIAENLKSALICGRVNSALKSR
jgi:hypothetical protein